MHACFGEPSFTFSDSAGKAIASQFPDGGKAHQITAQGKTVILYPVLKGRDAKAAIINGKFMVLPIYYNEPHAIQPCLAFYENYGTNASIHADINYGVMVGFPVNIVIELSSLNLSTLFLPRRPGSFKIMATGDPVRPEAIDMLVLTIPESAAEYTVYIGNPYLTNEIPDTVFTGEPQVDKLGQWMRKEWSGKTKNEAEMISNYQQWLSEAQPVNMGYASGFFTTTMRNGMHTLLDPDGNPFFSLGVDCVLHHSDGPVTGAEGLHEELPPKTGRFAPAWSTIHRSHTSEYSADMFDFAAANLIRAFGDNWYEAWCQLTAYRLKHWGFNTIANWSDVKLAKACGLPYVIELPYPGTEMCLFRDFPDVFSPEYQSDAERCAEYLTDYTEDHNLIGYFMRNEPNFAFGDYNIAMLMLQSCGDTYSRREFINDMKRGYANDIHLFNKGWGTAFGSFDALHKPYTGQYSHEAVQCLNDFTKKLFRQFIKVFALACRAVDPNHLNLGLRWAWIASDNFYEGAEFVDVFSINCYSDAIDPNLIARISQMAGGKPVIIGEFHAGALDAGLPTNGIRAVANQNERGYFYSYYIENGAVIPELVGAHYFQYNDQPVLGRFDGENCNIGLVDVCGKPYEAFITKVAQTNSKIQAIRAGFITPTDRKPILAPKEGF